MMAPVSEWMIAVVGIDMTMTAVTPIVTGLTGAIHSASAGSSMTVSPPRQACISSGPLPGSQRCSSVAIAAAPKRQRRRIEQARRRRDAGAGGSGLSAQTTKDAAVPIATSMTRLTAVSNAPCGWLNDISMTRHAVTAPTSQA